jgi:uncharacterized protein YcnI
MRCSGWSLRAISACSAAGAALLLAASASASASARLSITPASVQAGTLVDLVFSVPNANDKLWVERVTLGMPPDFSLTDGEARAGWSQSRTGQAITWSGGKIPKGQFARFAIRGVAPPHAETAVFNVLVGDRRGKSITYHVRLEVLAHGPRDSGARSLGKAALVVAVIAGLLSLGALFTSLSGWFRSRR